MAACYVLYTTLIRFSV